MIIYSAYLPHPPIMIPQVGGDESLKVKKTIESQKKIIQDIKALEAQTDLLVIMSPHAPAAENSIPVLVADEYAGDLGNFMHPELKKTFTGSIDDPLIEDLAGRVAIEVHDFAELDHGVLVPLFGLNDYQPPVLLVGICIEDKKAHFDFGVALAEYAETSGRNIVFVGSGDMSHMLSEDGPYGFDKSGPVFDQEVVDILSDNDLPRLQELDQKLCESAAECGYRSLLTLAGIASVTDHKPEVLSYEGPFGVGYLAARWR